MSIERRVARSKDGDLIRIGDLVTVGGHEPDNAAVYYSSHMKRMMGRRDVLCVDRIIKTDGDQTVIQANGWNWDVRSVVSVRHTKLPLNKEELPSKKEKYMFKVENIDI